MQPIPARHVWLWKHWTTDGHFEKAHVAQLTTPPVLDDAATLEAATVIATDDDATTLEAATLEAATLEAATLEAATLEAATLEAALVIIPPAPEVDAVVVIVPPEPEAATVVVMVPPALVLDAPFVTDDATLVGPVTVTSEPPTPTIVTAMACAPPTPAIIPPPVVTPSTVDTSVPSFDSSKRSGRIALRPPHATNKAITAKQLARAVRVMGEMDHIDGARASDGCRGDPPRHTEPPTSHAYPGTKISSGRAPPCSAAPVRPREGMRRWKPWSPNT